MMVEMACYNWNIAISCFSNRFPIIHALQHRNKPTYREGRGREEGGEGRGGRGGEGRGERRGRGRRGGEEGGEEGEEGEEEGGGGDT